MVTRAERLLKGKVRYWSKRTPQLLEAHKLRCRADYARLTTEEKRARAHVYVDSIGIEAHRKQSCERVRRYAFGPNRAGYLLSKRAAQMRRKYNTPETTREQLQFVYERNIKQHGTLTCYLCVLDGVKDVSIKFGEDSIDHKVPVCRKDEFPTVNVGGTDNLDVVHKRCNSSKGIMTPEEWLIRK